MKLKPGMKKRITNNNMRKQAQLFHFSSHKTRDYDMKRNYLANQKLPEYEQMVTVYSFLLPSNYQRNTLTFHLSENRINNQKSIQSSQLGSTREFYCNAHLRSLETEWGRSMGCRSGGPGLATDLHTCLPFTGPLMDLKCCSEQKHILGFNRNRFLFGELVKIHKFIPYYFLK